LLQNRTVLFTADTRLLYPEFLRLGEGKFRMANLSFIRQLNIPLPDLTTQRAIVAEIEAEQALVASNRELIHRMEAKVKAAIDRVWGSTSDN
jgi:restriction endonuclease S subunit